MSPVFTGLTPQPRPAALGPGSQPPLLSGQRLGPPGLTVGSAPRLQASSFLASDLGLKPPFSLCSGAHMTPLPYKQGWVSGST